MSNRVDHASIAVSRRAARAILIDQSDYLVLIKRTKSGHAAYWTAPGGGVEDTDVSLEAALRRELAEELGAEVGAVSRVFLCSSRSEAGLVVQHFFLARLVTMNESARSGPEFENSARGHYDVDRVDLRSDVLASLEVKPPALKEFVVTNREALLAEVA